MRVARRLLILWLLASGSAAAGLQQPSQAVTADPTESERAAPSAVQPPPKVATPPDADEPQPQAKTRAFEPIPVENVSRSQRDILVVFAIAGLGVVLLFVGIYTFYSPKAWQRPYRPTELPARARPPEEKERPDVLERDRYGLEGEIGDMVNRLRDEERGET